MTNSEFNLAATVHAAFEKLLKTALDQGFENLYYTPETIEALSKAINDHCEPLFALPFHMGCPYPIPGRDATLTVAIKPPDSKVTLSVAITLNGPDARRVAEEWGYEIDTPSESSP
jgi:hypothetical protein